MDPVKSLYERRERSVFVPVSALLLLLLGIGAWWFVVEESAGSVLTWEQREQNVTRFLDEARPYPMQEGKGYPEVKEWLWKLLDEKAFDAAWLTVCFAAVSVFLSTLFSLVTLPFASRNLVASNPLGIPGREKGWLSHSYWGVIRVVTRFCYLLSRTIPEYVLVFLFFGMIVSDAWPIVLALAIHNLGILGRLQSEVIENADQNSARQIMAAGGGRYKAYFWAFVPIAFNRFFVYFAYRWETCVREATILGMVSGISIGYYVDEAKARQYHDEMLVFMLVGAVLVLIGDFVSSIIRWRLRKK